MSVRWTFCILFCGAWSGDIQCRIVDSSYGMFTNSFLFFCGSQTKCAFNVHVGWPNSGVVIQRQAGPVTQSIHVYMTRPHISIAATCSNGISPTLARSRLIISRQELTRICQRCGFLHASTPLSLQKPRPALGFGSSDVPTVVQVAISLSSHVSALAGQ